MMEDSLAEDRHSPVPGLVHRYPDRVLMLVTTQCASYLPVLHESADRRRPGQNFNRKEHEAQPRLHPPDAPDPRRPDLRRRRPDAGAEASRVPCCAGCATSRTWRSSGSARGSRSSSPSGSTKSWARCSRNTTRFWLNIHVNHPNEITPELAPRRATSLRAPASRSGTSLCSWPASTTASTSSATWSSGSWRIRVRPYYIYQCDLIEGAGPLPDAGRQGSRDHGGAPRPHLRLRRPQYIVDAPGGGGKIPVMPTTSSRTRTTRSCSATTRGTSPRTRSRRTYTPHG